MNNHVPIHALSNTLKIILLFHIICTVLFPQATAGDFPGAARRAAHLSIEDGLSQVSVNCILQDNRGFMWFGTQDGLNRFDGYELRVYHHEFDNPDNLLSDYIYALHQSPGEPGIIRVGTASGLCRYDARTERFTAELKGPQVTAILETDRDTLWLGTLENGLIKWNKSTGEQHSFKNTPGQPPVLAGNQVTKLAWDGGDNLWIGSEVGGLTRLNLKTETWKIYTKNHRELKDDHVMCILCEQGGVTWIGTEYDGLFRITQTAGGDERFTQFTAPPGNTKQGRVNSILRDSMGQLWIGVENSGLLTLRETTGQWTIHPLSSNSPYGLKHTFIFCLYEDHAGSLWLGTEGMGLFRIDNRYRKFSLYQYFHKNIHGLAHKEVWGICESRDGSAWVGTDGGLYRFDMTAGRFEFTPLGKDADGKPVKQRVISVFEEEDGQLWVGTDGGGIYHRVPGEERFRHYPAQPDRAGGLTYGEVVRIFKDSGDNLWFGTDGGGVCQIHPENRGDVKFHVYRRETGHPRALNANRIYDIYESPDGIMWFGTFGGGINLFDRQKDTWSYLTHDPGNDNTLSSNRIICFCPDDGDHIWIGTSHGLNRYNPQTGQWNRYTTKDGLINNVVYGIIIEDAPGNTGIRHLWMSTNKGISRFNPGTGEFRNYDVHDGLQGNEFNSNGYLKSSTGIIFFGGMNGLNVFHPRQVKDNSHRPPVAITGFRIFNKPVPVRPEGGSPLTASITETDEILLDHRQNSFSIEFAALDYMNPGKSRYRYQLENFNDQWVNLDKRQAATYTNIPPGTYTFHVNASNNDGVWNESGSSLTIIITPPFWQTTWFKILAILVLVSIMYGLHRYNTAHLKEKMEKESLESELKLKADFTAMLVHDLRSPLSAIMGYSGMMTDMPDRVDIPRTGKMISRISDKMLVLINNMLELSRYEAGKMKLNRREVPLDEIVSETLILMSPLFEQKNIRATRRLSREDREKPLLLDPDRIGEVVNNLVGNAVKFSPRGGRITLHCCDVEETGTHYREFSVTDEGPGVPVEKQAFLFEKYAQLDPENKLKGTGLGLAVSRVIIESHGGRIGYRAGPGDKGSTFYFRIPRTGAK